jgi:hypothetical protein
MEWFSPSALGNNPKPTRNPPKKPNATPFSKEMITQIVTFLGRAEDCLDVSAKIDNFLSRLPPKAPKTAVRELFADAGKYFRPGYPSPAEAKALKEKKKLEKEEDEYFDELLEEWERTTMLAGDAAPPVITWVEQRGHDPMVIRRLLAALEHPSGFMAHGRALLSDLEALVDTILSGKPKWLLMRRQAREKRELQLTPNPDHVPLIGGKAILRALDAPSNQWRAIARYNAQTHGPIKRGAKGKRPFCYRDELLIWWRDEFLLRLGRRDRDSRKIHDRTLNDAIGSADPKNASLVANDFDLTRVGAPNMRTHLRKKR